MLSSNKEKVMVTSAPETCEDEKLYFASTESVAGSLIANFKTDAYSLTVDRYKVSRRALIFYKKALNTEPSYITRLRCSAVNHKPQWTTNAHF